MPSNPADYVRPTAISLSIEQKRQLLADQIAYYAQIREEKGEEKFRQLMSRKLRRRLLARTLSRIGGVIQQEARELATGSSEEAQHVQAFLKGVPLPPTLAPYLSTEYRTFALLLNALKQWLSAEQASTDRYLLGGTARPLCRQASAHCLVTQVRFGTEQKKELHHTVRDGRPPIALSAVGHRIIDNQVSSDDDPWRRALQAIRGTRSWAGLRRGCEALLTNTDTPRSQDKTWARAALKELQKLESTVGYDQLISWLDEHEMGL